MRKHSPSMQWTNSASCSACSDRSFNHERRRSHAYELLLYTSLQSPSQSGTPRCPIALRSAPVPAIFDPLLPPARDRTVTHCAVRWFEQALDLESTSVTVSIVPQFHPFTTTFDLAQSTTSPIHLSLFLTRYTFHTLTSPMDNDITTRSLTT